MKYFQLLATSISLAPFVHCHVFMGNPPPFRWGEVSIDELIMPMNGLPGVYGQQPFPCKGHHLAIDGPEGSPRATWTAGQKATIQ
jgi:hypothetical protein